MSWMTNAWAVRDHAALDELGEALSVDLPELLADVSDLLRARWPEYAQCLDEAIEGLGGQAPGSHCGRECPQNGSPRRPVAPDLV